VARFAIGPKVDTPEFVLRVAALVPHPSYDPDTLAHDIAYVELDHDAPVQPLAVVGADDPAWTQGPLFFVGYGVYNGSSGKGAGRKRAVWMDVSEVRSQTFSYGGDGKNTCNGDSGGPALYRPSQGTYLITGVTSWGDAGCGLFGVDTRADVYRAFWDLQGEDPCAGETYAGRCDGDVVVWCEDQQVEHYDCGAVGSACGWSADAGYYDCTG
jgi:hypothetical protein